MGRYKANVPSLSIIPLFSPKNLYLQPIEASQYHFCFAHKIRYMQACPSYEYNLIVAHLGLKKPNNESNNKIET